MRFNNIILKLGAMHEFLTFVNNIHYIQNFYKMIINKNFIILRKIFSSFSIVTFPLFLFFYCILSNLYLC